MKNVAVICEYNPFHKGHEEQIRIIRSSFDEEVRIISVMSGSVVQRGETAIYDKYQRARAAVLCGSNLVLELPYPYSGSCAELFAAAGVSLILSLGNIDYLVFGSECGDIDQLERAANRLSSSAFEEEMIKISALYPHYSYPKKRAECYRLLYREELSVTPNDILGIEYIKAIKRWGQGLIPMTYKRQRGYSASEARRVCLSSFENAADCIPSKAVGCFEDLEAVSMASGLGKTLLCFCRMTPIEYFLGVFDMPRELAARIKKSAAASSSFEEMISGAVSSRYTAARVKRCLLYAYMGVVNDPGDRPLFTNLLASDETGLEYLSQIKKRRGGNGDGKCENEGEEIKVITKPSSYLSFDDGVIRQYRLNLKADEVFCQCHGSVRAVEEYLRAVPYIMKKKSNN